MNKLFETAKRCVGLNLAPQFKEFGCVESLSNVFRQATGTELGENASTYKLYLLLEKDSRFIDVEKPLPGDLILSPTGFGSGKIANGHTGIVGEDCVYSNNSATLKFDKHYTLASWKKRYVDLGGFPMKFYRLIDKEAESKEIENLTKQLNLLQQLVATLKRLLNMV